MVNKREYTILQQPMRAPAILPFRGSNLVKLAICAI